MTQIILLGASNPHVERLLSRCTAADPDLNILGFIDDNPAKWGTIFAGYPVIGGRKALAAISLPEASFVNLISSNCAIRHETSRRLIDDGWQFANLIDPGVDMTGVQAGTGLYIQEGVLIQQSAFISDNVSIHMGALIAHECFIGESSFVAHAVSVSGCVDIEEGVYIGTNATILPNLTLGKWSVIGAGAVVTKDVPEYTVVAGNPAKVIREVR